ncbi:MAG TPA: hypothetical protein VHX49_15000 [Candidatus Acidoferrales bacterium]|jgi:hypothetical protein|nr:hypothetical protein [Candidatus Acidoferrales bacterium]
MQHSIQRLTTSLSICLFILASTGLLSDSARGGSPNLAGDRAASQNCDRTCLIGFVDRYLDALVKNDPSGLPLAAHYKFTENGQQLTLGEGLWHQAGNIQYRQYLADPERGAEVFYGALEESGYPTLLMLRLRVVDMKISEIETIVVRFDDGLDARIATLKETQSVVDSTLPEEQRSSKATLEAVANAYLDGLQDHPPGPVPVTPDCARTEDGRMTSRTAVNSDRPGFPVGCDLNSPVFSYMTSLHDRRFFVTDEVRGQAFVIAVMDCPGTLKTVEIDGKTTPLGEGARRPREVLLGAVFKVIGGKLRQVQAFHVTNLPYGSHSGW